MASVNPVASYEDKQRGYFNVDRHDLFQLVPSGLPGRVWAQQYLIVAEKPREAPLLPRAPI
jgi:hypothetical protein